MSRLLTAAVFILQTLSIAAQNLQFKESADSVGINHFSKLFTNEVGSAAVYF